MPLDTVAVFPSLPQTHRARIVLDEAGIDSEIGGEGLRGSDPFSPLLNRGTVQLLVDAERASEARRLLQENGYSDAIRRAKDQPAAPQEPTGPQHVRLAGLLIIFMSILLLISRGDPAAGVLIAIGVALAAFGQFGVVRARRKKESR